MAERSEDRDDQTVPVETARGRLRVDLSREIASDYYAYAWLDEQQDTRFQL